MNEVPPPWWLNDISNPFRRAFLHQNPIESSAAIAQKLREQLDTIDAHIHHPRFVSNFLGDLKDQLSIEEIIANHSQIQQLEYSKTERRYGFWWDEDQGEDPHVLYGLNPGQIYRLRYTIAAMREKLPEEYKNMIPDLDQ